MGLIQWEERGRQYMPCGTTAKILPAGVYAIGSTPAGIYFERRKLQTDDLLRFKDPTHSTIIGEINNFWSLKPKFSSMGFLHKRSILMHGPPGSGKSCISKIVVDDVVGRDNIVVNCDSLYNLSAGLKLIREVEPDRQILVLMEDIDSIDGQYKLLPLLDGEDSVNNILYLCTTNYIERLPERIIRPGRIDRKILVDCPPPAGRKAFLVNKLGADSQEIEGLVKATQGLSFAHLRELLIGIYCLSQEPDQVLKRLHNKSYEVLTPKEEYMMDDMIERSVSSTERKKATASVMRLLDNKKKVTASTAFKITAKEKKLLLKRRAK